MSGFVAQGATFTFCGLSAKITRLSVEEAQAEVVDMTPHNAPANQIFLVPTGAFSGGTVSVDYLASPGGVDPAALLGKVGVASFSGQGYGVARRAVCQSVTKEAAVGQLVSGTLTLRLTDYSHNDLVLGSL